MERIVGDLLAFRNLVYAPSTRQAVMFLFGMLSGELGLYVEWMGEGCPNCELRERADGGWKRLRAQVELKASDLLKSGKPADCDMVVCWEDDWGAKRPPECGHLEVLVLKKTVVESADFFRSMRGAESGTEAGEPDEAAPEETGSAAKATSSGKAPLTSGKPAAAEASAGTQGKEAAPSAGVAEPLTRDEFDRWIENSFPRETRRVFDDLEAAIVELSPELDWRPTRLSESVSGMVCYSGDSPFVYMYPVKKHVNISFFCGETPLSGIPSQPSNKRWTRYMAVRSTADVSHVTEHAKEAYGRMRSSRRKGALSGEETSEIKL